MATVTRRAVWRTGAADGWHDDLIWYAAAIHQMKTLTPRLDEFQEIFNQALPQDLPPQLKRQMAAIARTWSDPRSLGYQAQVHATYVAAASWPKHLGKKAIWQQCGHEHWFFLPWHRAYLVEFEAVVRAHIKDLGGPSDDWGLPYWNYSDHRTRPEALGLPKPLRNADLPAAVTVPGVAARPDGSFPNPLFDPTRLMTGDPDPADSTSWATPTAALLRPHFANQQDTGRVSFGGGVLERPNNAGLFHRGHEMGQLDAQPHGSVHNQVNGCMGLFETAGLDPAFWIHHCNVDRLWETYAQDLGHGYPFQSAAGPGGPEQQSWTEQQFPFLRPDATVKVWTSPEVTDVRTLGYVYDTTAAPPLPAVPPAPPPGAAVGPFGAAAASPPQPMASVREVTLAGTTNTRATTPPGTGPLPVGAFPPETQWTLRFTGIRASRPAPTSYEVYLGLADDDPSSPDDATHYVGLLSLFGVFEASLDNGSSAADGKMRLLDATPQVTALGESFDVGAATIRLVPVNPDRDLAGAGVSIEQVTLEAAS